MTPSRCTMGARRRLASVRNAAGSNDAATRIDAPKPCVPASGAAPPSAAYTARCRHTSSSSISIDSVVDAYRHEIEVEEEADVRKSVYARARAAPCHFVSSFSTSACRCAVLRFSYLIVSGTSSICPHGQHGPLQEACKSTYFWNVCERVIPRRELSRTVQIMLQGLREVVVDVIQSLDRITERRYRS